MKTRDVVADDIARLLILNGKGWHDEDGATIVEGIDAEEGAGYPVKYHWASGGAGADSVEGFVRNNYLPMGETTRIIADAFMARDAAHATEVAALREELRSLQEMYKCVYCTETATEVAALRRELEEARDRAKFSDAQAKMMARAADTEKDEAKHWRGEAAALRSRLEEAEKLLTLERRRHNFIGPCECVVCAYAAKLGRGAPTPAPGEGERG